MCIRDRYGLGPLRLHTTSTISGLVFIAIGVLFVVFDGTAGLSGTDPATAAAAEDTVAALGRHVPDLAALAVVAAITLGVVTWRLARPRRRTATPRASDRPGQGGRP